MKRPDAHTAVGLSVTAHNQVMAAGFIGLVPGKAMLLCVPGRPRRTPEPRLMGLVRVVR